MNKKRKATVIDNFFGKKCGRKSKFELERRKRKTASKTKTMTKTITNPDGTVETTTETVVTHEANLPNDESEETSEGTSAAREQLRAGTSRALKINWVHAENWPLLKEAMEHYCKPKASREKDVGKEEFSQVPRTTVLSALKQCKGKYIEHSTVFPNTERSLLDNKSLKVIQDIIMKRDQNNMELSRKECICLVMDIGEAESFQVAENHYSYCVRKGKFPNLTKGGRVITAQATSTERCAITGTQQYR
jgi:hypothetical protein